MERNSELPCDCKYSCIFNLTRQYMVLLGILFLVQFSISVAALAVGNNQYDSTAASGWCKLKDSDKNDLQKDLSCFGYSAEYLNTTGAGCMGPGSVCPTSKPCF